MELRKMTICLAFFILAVLHCTESRHSVHRRNADYDYEDQAGTMNDEAAEEDDTQNDEDEKPKPQKPPALMVTKAHIYEAHIGDTVRFECHTNPENGTSVSWYKNDVLYFMAAYKLYTEATRYSLVPDSKDLEIKSVQADDAGIYRCEIAQTVPASVNHTLIVFTPPKIIRMDGPFEGITSENDDVTINCTISGIPAPQVIWSLNKGKDNELMTEKEAEFFVNGNVQTMIIKNIQLSQAGRYMCYVINDLGHDEQEFGIAVNGKPRVNVHKTAVNTGVNVEAVLQCSAHERPVPYIRWYKDGIPIEKNTSSFFISTHHAYSNLTVVPTADQDFGTFTCEAENSYGKHSRSIELVQRPVVEDLEIHGPKLAFTIHSHQPLEQIELQLRNVSGGEWLSIPVPLPEVKNHKYDMVFSLENKKLEEGRYEVNLKVKNSHSWGSPTEPAYVDIEDIQPEYIQHASVFRENNGAYAIRPTSAVLSTILMYVFVRLL